jgi:hypothetical protein
MSRILAIPPARCSAQQPAWYLAWMHTGASPHATVGQGPPYDGSLPASRFCFCSCGQEPALFHGAPGERREAVDPPAGAAAGMRPMFVTGQGRPVHEHPRTHANPSRTDARRARTRGGLSLAYLSLATQRKVGRAARRADRKLLLFASSNRATEQRSNGATEQPSETGASVKLMVGQGPPYDGRRGRQPEGLTESSCSSPPTTNAQSQTEARVKLMVVHGPPYARFNQPL